MNVLAYFEIQASDPQKTMLFYKSVFGWEFEKQENLPIQYWHIHTNGIHGGLLESPAKIPPPECGTNAFTCSMEVEDFDKKAQLIIDNGGQIALTKFAIPGKCWQGYFIDVDNNVFGIFQVDKNAE